MKFTTVNSRLQSVSPWLLWCGLGLIAAGCQQEPTTVEGLVTLDGRPLAIREGMRGTVVYQPALADGITLNGTIDAHGRYELSAGSSTSVMPSVYWVTVSAVELLPADEDRPQATGRRVTPAKYATATDSGFRVEVRPGANEVNLELKTDTVPEGESAADTGDAASAEATAAEIDK